MKNETILAKAINKAIMNGWDDNEAYIDFSKGEISIIDIIFRHDFARAVGYKLEDLGKWCDDGKEPLKYLEKFL